MWTNPKVREVVFDKYVLPSTTFPIMMPWLLIK